MNPDRCSLVLVANPDSATPEDLEDIASTGLIACCILYNTETAEKEFHEFCTQGVSSFHKYDTPVLVADDSQTMGRCRADGLYLEKQRNELSSFIEQFASERMIGCGNFRKRHAVLEAGEAGVDFLFFGKLGGDTRPEAHPRNLQMAEWSSEILTVSTIVLAGNSIESVVDCAFTGAEFVAVEQAVLGGTTKAADAVRKADQLLQQNAPRFEDVEA